MESSSTTQIAWQDALVDHFPEAAKLSLDEKKSNRWLREIDLILVRKPLGSRSELVDAIRWAARKLNRHDTFNPPSVDEVAGWVRRYRIAQREAEAPEKQQRYFEDMDPATQKLIKDLYGKFKTGGSETIGQGYREVEAGEILEPTDEIPGIADGEWEPMGDAAYNLGKPRRLVKYHGTIVRRAMLSGGEA